MDYKDEQIQEIEALKSIYPKELQIGCEEYPNISFHVRLSTNQNSELSDDQKASSEDDESDSDSEEEVEDEKDGLRCLLIVSFPETYPETAPNYELSGLDDDISLDRFGMVVEKLNATIEESLGMAMAFTLISTLQVRKKYKGKHKEELAILEEEIAAAKEAERDRIIREAEEAERKRLDGTVVSVETFLAWKQKFDAERLAKRKAAEAAKKDGPKRLTGREQFLKDATLNLSDLKLIQESGDDEPVKIDESLFEDLDDLELEDDED